MAKHPPAAATLAAEYVVLGPITDLQALAEALLDQPLSDHPRPPIDPLATAVVDTTHLCVYVRNDGARIIEIHTPDGQLLESALRFHTPGRAA